MRNQTRRQQTKCLTLSAMLCAVSTLLLALGSLIEVLDLTAAVLASVLCIYAVIEIRGPYPWGIWLVTSTLSLLLLPQKTPAIFYAFFAGFYPILKEKFERLKRPLCLALKLITLHLCLALIYLVLQLFLPSFLESDTTKLFYALLYAALLVCFFIYDLALTRLITFYLLRLRNRFRIK